MSSWVGAGAGNDASPLSLPALSQSTSNAASAPGDDDAPLPDGPVRPPAPNIAPMPLSESFLPVLALTALTGYTYEADSALGVSRAVYNDEELCNAVSAVVRVRPPSDTYELFPGRSRLQWAIMRGDEARARKFLTRASFQLALTDGLYPIHFFAIMGMVGCLRTVLAWGEDVNRESSDSNLSVLYFRLSMGDRWPSGEPDYAEPCTALHMAAFTGKLDSLRFLIEEAGADTGEGASPLLYHAAVIGKSLGALLRLLPSPHQRPDPDEADDCGRTALHYAAILNRPDDARMLVAECGADLEEYAQKMYPIEKEMPFDSLAETWTPFHFAAWHGNVEAAKVLLELGSDPMAFGVHEATALHAVVCCDSPDDSVPMRFVREVLMPLPCFTDLVSSRDDWGAQPLHLAATYANVALCELLLDHGADVNAGSDNYMVEYYEQEALEAAVGPRLWTPLAYTFCQFVMRDDKEAFVDTARLLLRRGANPNFVTTFGSLLSGVLEYYPDPAFVTELIDVYGADPNLKPPTAYPGQTALHIACQQYGLKGDKEVLECIRVLLRRGCSADDVDAKGNTPIQIAVLAAPGGVIDRPAAKVPMILEDEVRIAQDEISAKRRG
jgi:ankyrin repeat protein